MWASQASNYKLDVEEFQDCKQMVWDAAQRYLESDLADFKFEEPERKLAALGVKGFLDLSGAVREKPKTKAFKEFAGKKVVIDWKTRADSSLDELWKTRLIDSWQWRMYAAMSRADLFLYRGLNRNGDQREIVIPVPATNYAETEEYLTASGIMLDNLIDGAPGVWPRRMGHSTCEAFARQCPFYDECRWYSSIPVSQEPIRKKVMSYSSLELFHLCPERFRRTRLLEIATADNEEGWEDSNEVSRFGKVFHVGISQVYRQAIAGKET